MSQWTISCIEKSKYQNSKSHVLKFPGFNHISKPGFQVARADDATRSIFLMTALQLEKLDEK